MPRRVLITGLGTINAAGMGIDALWDVAIAGESQIKRIQKFDPSGFASQIAGEVADFKVNKIVPKTYRKATKVMARDITLAVGAADSAATDAKLITASDISGADRSYPGNRCGCHIGAGLIAADLNELTLALSESGKEDGSFDIHHWGNEGIQHLTPLWLLKYLPNMLASHVTIIHDLQGPSNTITCAEASSGLSIGESLRVIQRNAADLCFSGGAESKLDPMGMLRQHFTERLTATGNDQPSTAVKPFDQNADGTAIGEGSGILILEAAETAEKRNANAYAEIVGYGARNTFNPEKSNTEPDAQGLAIAGAIKAALAEAKIQPSQINVIVPFGSGIPAYDQAEAAALKTIFGQAISQIPLWSVMPYIGNCFAGGGAISVAMASKMLRHQQIPARINCDHPIEGLQAQTSKTTEASLEYALVCSTGLGGQNVALVLKKV